MEKRKKSYDDYILKQIEAMNIDLRCDYIKSKYFGSTYYKIEFKKREIKKVIKRGNKDSYKFGEYVSER
jgi:hypothetical protein